MRRRVLYLLFTSLAIALVGSVKGQDAKQKDVEFIKYPITGSEDAVGEFQTVEERKVLNDFYQSKVQEQLHQAALTNDPAKFDRLLAYQMNWVSERFGRGITLTKAQVLNDFRSSYLHVNTHTHSHVRLVVFGNTTVIVTGRSYSTLIYGGEISNGPRMFAQVWVKLDGRWQMVAYHVSDIEGP